MRSYRDLDRVRSDCKKIEITRIEECHIYANKRQKYGDMSFQSLSDFLFFKFRHYVYEQEI